MIFHENLLDDLIDLKKSIDHEVIVLSNKKMETSLASYSPWLCGLVQNEGDYSFHPVYNHQPSKGEILSDPETLKNLDDFLRKDGALVWDLSEEKTGISDKKVTDIGLMDPISAQIIEFYEISKAEIKKGPLFSKGFDDIVDVVVPVSAPNYKSYSYSTILARGAIFIEVPYTRKYGQLLFEMSLVHELGHQILFLLQCTDTLIHEKDILTPIWSGIRQQSRPAIKAMHGLVALSFMLNYIGYKLKKAEMSTTEMEILHTYHSDYLNKAKETSDAIKNNCSLTELGEQVHLELSQIALKDELV